MFWVKMCVFVEFQIDLCDDSNVKRLHVLSSFTEIIFIEACLHFWSRAQNAYKKQHFTAATWLAGGSLGGSNAARTSAQCVMEFLRSDLQHCVSQVSPADLTTSVCWVTLPWEPGLLLFCWV